ncbi:SKA complex subunit 1 [Xylocopa sonorina]|uniref:SKA complex subunit 1 n=1 Tax=Xylocopa sonorina TaxID=1818115 RepID=UPI00403AE31B
MTTPNSLEEILEKQSENLRLLETATIFIKSKHTMKEEFLKMRSVLSQMFNGIESMRQWLDEAREQNNQCRELLSLFEILSERITYMEKNIPLELIRDYNNAEIKIVESSPDDSKIENVAETMTPMVDCKKVLFNEPEVYCTIPLINNDEFVKIPKYIIGRQSLENVNNLINTINQILKAKYTFLSLGKANARKQGNLSLYLHYRKQEMDICNDNEYIYFFTAEDYEKHTKSKLTKIKLNLITVLRHCKRLREHRVKNNIRYVICNK